MKKYLVMTLLISKLLYSQEVTLDDLLNQLDKTSYENKIFQIKNQRDDIRENIYKSGKYNGVNVAGDSDYKDEEKVYTMKGTLSYGDFYVQGEKKKNQDDRATFGVEKSLKDWVFSKEDSQLNKLKVSRNITELEWKQALENQKLNLINLYKTYKDNQFELKLKKNALKTLEKEKKILEKSYQLDHIAKIDLDSLMVTYNNINLEIKNIEQILNKIIGRFYYDYGITLKDKTLKDLNPSKNNLEKYISQVGEKQLQKLSLEKEITKENIKYLKYDNSIPDISLGLERNKDENRIFLKFSKDLFHEDIDLTDQEGSLREQEVTYTQKSQETLGERYKIQDSFYTLEKEFLVLQNKVSLEKSKYEIKKLENSLGKISYTEVMESFDDYLQLQVQEEKAKNSLNAYIYEIIVRGEI